MRQELPGGFKRKYRYRGGGSDAEQKRFWIVLAVTLAIVFGLFYFFG